MNTNEITKLRAEYIGPSFSLSYTNPLHIVRGWMQHLYDETGREYLDCVNNVAHVGHCHPRVVKAGQDQMAVLNTNTRYLHENIVTYARRLCETLPHPLRVCFFTNSGSEANELALRLARAHTNNKQVMVLDSAYHGNTTTLIEVSPYKFNGPGGAGKPDYVHVVPLPDVYRGPHRDPEQAGALYGRQVLESVVHVQESKGSLGAFLCEPMPGVAGQIILPKGYLALAYHYARETGAVCIADEVQTGFGRAGSHFWAFETQGVIPDIVTLGKPIGNGHPMGAVITTREIAESFNNGMEYFNTFGGNPVSCAIGIAVLDVLKDDRLQENARDVGEYLLGRLRELADRHALIGDVRGCGLYIGIELVKDRETKEPAAAEAAAIIDRLRERFVLLSTDGPLHNVLKIKPPLVFSAKDGDMLIAELDSALREEG